MHQEADLRPKFNTISYLRSWRPSVPVLTMSATLPVHVQAYIHRTLRLSVISGPTMRDNLYIQCTQMNHCQKLMKDLDFLISNGVTAASDIPKTIMFINSRTDIPCITSYLIARRDFKI